MDKPVRVRSVVAIVTSLYDPNRVHDKASEELLKDLRYLRLEKVCAVPNWGAGLRADSFPRPDLHSFLFTGRLF
jgi:hypothetical protein